MYSHILSQLSWVKSARVLPLAVAAIVLASCSSSESETPDILVAADDPAFVLPGERPVINADVVSPEVVEFVPPSGATQNLLDTMSASGTFTRLLALIDQAGLASLFSEDNPLTLFAPTDNAFSELDAAMGEGLLASLGAEELNDRLNYHVVTGAALNSTSLRAVDGKALDMANELPAAISINSNGQLQINGSVLQTADIVASNGILHIIDSVLTPPLRPADPNANIPAAISEDISTTLLRRSDYSTLLRLIEQAGLTEQLQEDNEGSGWTLFAPSDTAFEGFDVSSVDAVGAAELVEQHLYSGTIATEELPDGLLDMVQGSVQVVRVDGQTIVGGATIVGRDRVVGNGVIHFVGALLSVDVN